LKNRARDTSLENFDEMVASDPGRRASGVQARARRAEPEGATAATPQPLISIGAPADLALLEPTYAYLSAYCFTCFPPRLAERLNVAIYELYANALRYGSPQSEVRLIIERSARGGRLRIRNHAAPSHLESLEAQLSSVQQDPAAAFSREMNRFAGASEPPPMLGIVRVAHEAALRLGATREADWIEVSTSCEA
jgi:hypothetical protein